MKYLVLSSIIISIFLLYHLSNIKEGIQNKPSTIVLLGDSIFQNKNYVPKHKSIEYLLKEKLTIPSIVLAEDNATIFNLQRQYNKIPNSINKSSTNLYISIGGNDLLNGYELNNINDYTLFNAIWNLYTQTITSLIENTLCNIILTDIYYITDPNYKKYLPIIEHWNSNLYLFAKRHDLQVFKISKILTKPTDFTHSIEPSVSGGKKLVNSFI